MKKLIAVTGVLLISSIIITSYLTPSDYEAAQMKNHQEENVQSAQELNTGYIVSVFSGRIALYRKRDKKVLFSTDTLVSDLPEADQNRLKQGIEAADMNEADNIIKELCS